MQPRPRRIAVGTFDGVHLGHGEVIRGADTVVTFEPNPVAIVARRRAARCYDRSSARPSSMGDLGVQEFVVIRFDQEFAARSAAELHRRRPCRALHAEHVSVGENFRFGHKAAGDEELLRADHALRARAWRYLLEVDGEVVSSSHIRGLVWRRGEYADKLLGAPFTVAGGRSRRRAGTMPGFPTANLVP